MKKSVATSTSMWIESWCPVVAQACSQIADDNPSKTYENAVRALIGDGPTETSYAGGYPLWIQSDDTPACPDCDAPEELVLQVGSDEETGLVWVDLGAAYLFTCRAHPTEFELVLQFH